MGARVCLRLPELERRDDEIAAGTGFLPLASPPNDYNICRPGRHASQLAKPDRTDQ